MRFMSDKTYKPTEISKMESIFETACNEGNGLLKEHEAYSLFKLIGIDIPKHHYESADRSHEGLEGRLPGNGPLVAKTVYKGVTHKTETGGLIFGVNSKDALGAISSFEDKVPEGSKLEGVLFVEQIDYSGKFGSEYLLGSYQDPFFGSCMVFGFGGTQTENYKSLMKSGMSQLFLPSEVELGSIEKDLENLPAIEYLTGKMRGEKKSMNFDEILSTLNNFKNLKISEIRNT